MPKYDVLLWGCTGYSGRLIAHYLAGRCSGLGLRWAVCGRDVRRVEEVAEAVARDGGAAPDVVVGDAADARSVQRAVASTRTVIAAAGPFTKVGTPVVQACVENATPYVDITGETPWVRQVIDNYHAAASDARIAIVPNCGFDCVPSDLGCYHAAAVHLAKTGTKPHKIRGYFNLRGGLSGGTVNTGITLEEEGFGTLRQMGNPFLLGGAPSSGKPRPEDRDVRQACYSEELGVWTGPFLMATINSRVVRRSFDLFAREESPFDAGEDGAPCYTEYGVAGDTEDSVKPLLYRPSLEQRKQLVSEGKLPAPGDGPSRAMRDRSSFLADFFSESAGGGPVTHTRVSGKDAYAETAVMASEAALLLLQGTSKHGVLTPSYAFGQSYIDALSATGISFATI